MKRSDFSYHLPQHLVAQYPLVRRTDSRLLHLEGQSGAISHHHFVDLPGFLRPDDLLVFNNTRVIPARLWGLKETGGRLEILIERIMPISEEIKKLLQDINFLDSVLLEGSNKADKIASKKVKKMKELVGF